MVKDGNKRITITLDKETQKALNDILKYHLEISKILEQDTSNTLFNSVLRDSKFTDSKIIKLALKFYLEKHIKPLAIRLRPKQPK